MVTINYPASLDAFPEPDETTYRDDPGFELDVLVAKALAAAEALQAKVGVGATTPDAAHKTYKATAPGVGAWGYYGPVKLDEIGPIGSAQASLNFASIPATFRNLHFVIQARGTAVATSSLIVARFNNDSGSNYDYEQLIANVTSATAVETLAQTVLSFGSIPAASASPSSLAAQIQLRIANYASTTFQKTVIGEIANKIGTSSGNIVRLSFSGFWRSTAAINRVEISPGTGNFEIGTVATLYGEP